MSITTPVPYGHAAPAPEPRFLNVALGIVRDPKEQTGMALVALAVPYIPCALARVLCAVLLATLPALGGLNPRDSSYLASALTTLPTLTPILVAPFWASAARATARMFAGGGAPSPLAALDTPSRGAFNLVLLLLVEYGIGYGIGHAVSSGLDVYAGGLAMLLTPLLWPAEYLVALRGQGPFEALRRVAHAWITSPWRMLRATGTVMLFSLAAACIPVVSSAWSSLLKIAVVHHLFEPDGPRG